MCPVNQMAMVCSDSPWLVATKFYIFEGLSSLAQMWRVVSRRGCRQQTAVKNFTARRATLHTKLTVSRKLAFVREFSFVSQKENLEGFWCAYQRMGRRTVCLTRFICQKIKKYQNTNLAFGGSMDLTRQT